MGGQVVASLTLQQGSETIVHATARPGAFHRHAYQRKFSSGHANHHDQVTPSNLPGGKPGSARHPAGISAAD
jgi:hypothetical protein